MPMAGNTYGVLFRLTTYGESHGAGIGGVVDGCPAGLALSVEAIQRELDRRRPGQSDLSSPRSESDTITIQSGLLDGVTTGSPIAFYIANRDQRSGDYEALKGVYRPSHADFVWEQKYGLRDHRGGGRSSARETAARVAGGAIARQYLAQLGISLRAWVSAIGSAELAGMPGDDLLAAPENELRCPHPATATAMRSLIEEARVEGDTLGGIITCKVRGVPAGLGEPVFDKLHADLGKAMLSINAVKGFETGSGFAASRMRGSEHNDAFHTDPSGAVRTTTNHSGGIQGGISNGMDIVMRIAFKPVASIKKVQQTIDKSGEATTIQVEGRHDPCVVPRAVPIVEAMAALTIADHHLRHKTARL